MAPHGIPREPYAGIDGSLRALAGQAEGFGEDTVGGLEGPVFAVTTLAGMQPGLDSCSCAELFEVRSNPSLNSTSLRGAALPTAKIRFMECRTKGPSCSELAHHRSSGALPLQVLCI